MADPRQPYHLTADGALSLDFHRGQWRAWDSNRRFVFVTAGTQGGKTSFGPFWLHREIYHPKIGRGGGDYLAVTATYDLFKLKMLPALRETFETVLRCGRYWAGDKILELANPAGQFWAKRADDKMWGRIILRSAESQSGLESSSARAAWLDECGMDSFEAETWRAIRRRLSLAQGRVLGTTTLYVLHNWLKALYDEFRDGRQDTEFIHFSSIENPAFPIDEYQMALAEMPAHVVNMQYRGMYDQPPGLIYDVFDSGRHTINPFRVPTAWMGYGGLDFGGVNTAALLLRYDPAGDVYYLTTEYEAGGKTAGEHCAALSEWEARDWFGGAPSEGQWRLEFGRAGLPVRQPPTGDVEVGIGQVYALIKTGRLRVFDTCRGVLQQMGTYSRKLDRDGRATAEIADKSRYHLLDALRYAVSGLTINVNFSDVADLGRVEEFETRWT